MELKRIATGYKRRWKRGEIRSGIEIRRIPPMRHNYEHESESYDIEMGAKML